jgi:hypothetical protein
MKRSTRTLTRTPTPTSARPAVVRLVAAASVGAALLATSALTDGPAMAYAAAATPGGSANHSRDGAGKQLAALKSSLAGFKDVAVAEAAGFVPVSACTVSDEGGMGVHYLNPARAAQPPNPAKPAILLYAPTTGGSLRLLGAEWFQADADQELSTDADRPTLFGQPFNGPMAGHDPMMPVHYDLHVWLYDSNPDGVFAPWNPSVTC